MRKIAIIGALILFALPAFALDPQQLIAAGRYAEERQKVDVIRLDLRDDPEPMVYIEVNFNRVRLPKRTGMNSEIYQFLGRTLSALDDDLSSKIDQALRAKKENKKP